MLKSEKILMSYSRMSAMMKRSLTIGTFMMFLGVMLLGFVISSAQVSVQPALGDTAADQLVSMDAPTISSSRSSLRDIDAAGYWTEERMRSARPAEELASEPSHSDRIRPAEQSSKMKVGENFSHSVRPKPLPGHQTGNAVVPEMTGAVFFNDNGDSVDTSSFTDSMEGH